MSCSELGLGHVSRVIQLGKRLGERGHQLFFFSGGNAYKLLKGEFENVYPCTPIAWYESSFGVIPSASILNILFPLPQYNNKRKRLELKSSSSAETIHRYYDLRRKILKIKPDLIISDGDITALRLAQRWKITSVYVTNIIRPSYSFSPLLLPGERFTERYVRKCEKIVVPDNPKHMICEYNLGNLEKTGIRDKVEFVGSFLDMTYERGLRKHIFASISGPLGTRAKMLKVIIPVLSSLKTKSIVSLGELAPKFKKKFGNCEIHSWLTNEERNEFMKNSEIVVFSGGHGTCFEVIKYRKPSVCVPTQPEQMGNARKMQELKCSISIENQEQLSSAIMEIQEKREFYEGNVRKMGQYSSRFKGLEKAVEIIENAV